MNTTTLFAELLVIGLHALVWIGILIISIVGYEEIDFEKLLSLNLALYLLGLAYIIAIIIDRISDTILISKDNRIRKENLASELPELLTMRYFVLSKSKEMFGQLQYIRSRLRIARASILNFTITAISGIVFVWFQLGNQNTQKQIILSIIIIIIATIIINQTYQAWVSLNKAYIASTTTAYLVLIQSDKENNNAKNAKA